MRSLQLPIGRLFIATVVLSVGCREDRADDDAIATTGIATLGETGPGEATDAGTADAGSESGSESESESGAEPPPACEPGVRTCKADAVLTCLADGSGFTPAAPCSPTQACREGACLEKCVLVTFAPSSVGCSFFAIKMDNYTAADDPQPEPPDSLVVGNISTSDLATVALHYRPEFDEVELMLGEPVVIEPGGVHIFELDAEPIESVSYLRVGGSYRVASDVPVVAYLHSPLATIQTNDASMLLPEHALRQNHIVASYYPWLTNYYPSYFDVIAVADGTRVRWTPPVATEAGVGVPAVAAGATGEVVLDRGDTLQVVAANHVEVSGTYVSADKPIAVLSGSEIVNVPAGFLYADHIEEQLLPLDYWGQEYVGPRAPPRGDERFHWRIYAGADEVTVHAAPNPGGFPITLDRGQWHEFSTTTSHVFTGSGPFMPIQYLEGKSGAGGAGTGDPSMVQMVPTAQFLDAYAFTTGLGYDVDYVQIIRAQGGAEVFVDAQLVDGWFAVGNYEVADVELDEGGHVARSEGRFGIINIGYTNSTSYAYPGGLRLAEINPQ